MAMRYFCDKCGSEAKDHILVSGPEKIVIYCQNCWGLIEQLISKMEDINVIER